MTTVDDKKEETATVAVEKAEMKPDLAHHKTEETDTLVKAETPADDFMKQKELDKDTHGKASE